MKLRLILPTALALFAVSAQGAISFTGTAAQNQKNSSDTNFGGTLALIIVDVDNNGILGGVTGNPSVTDPGLESLAAGLDIASTFGGDLVLARTETQDIASILYSISGNAAGLDNIASLQSKPFAIVYFESLATSATGQAANGTKYGVVQGDNWVMPNTNSGNYTFGAAGDFSQVNLGSSPATGGAEVATNGTVFAIVPEPTAAALGLLGFLGLLRRRR